MHARSVIVILLLLVTSAVFFRYSPTVAYAIPGDIANLNFAINNSYPWIQVVCGDLRMDNGITNKAPLGQSTLTTNGSCASPGVIFSGNGTTDFGQGQSSSSNQVVGGISYPEVYQSPSSNGIFSSYTYLLQKSQSGGLTTTNLASVCTLLNCTLPANLPKGIYVGNGDVNLNTYTFPLNQKYVFLINGNLTINGNIITPNSSTSVFSAAGNIIIPPGVGSPVNVSSANLAGIFSTDKALILQSNNNCTDLRLNVEGTLIVNAGRTGSKLQNNRDLCGSDGTYPTMSITQRLDYVLNLPEFMRVQSVTSQEVTP